MSKTVTIALDDLNSVVVAAVQRSLSNAGIHVGNGKITNEAVTYLGQALARAHAITGPEDQGDPPPPPPQADYTTNLQGWD